MSQQSPHGRSRASICTTDWILLHAVLGQRREGQRLVTTRTQAEMAAADRIRPHTVTGPRRAGRQRVLGPYVVAARGEMPAIIPSQKQVTALREDRPAGHAAGGQTAALRRRVMQAFTPAKAATPRRRAMRAFTPAIQAWRASEPVIRATQVRQESTATGRAATHTTWRTAFAPGRQRVRGSHRGLRISGTKLRAKRRGDAHLLLASLLAWFTLVKRPSKLIHLNNGAPPMAITDWGLQNTGLVVENSR